MFIDKAFDKLSALLPEESAEIAGLKYVAEGSTPCFRRRQRGKNFAYYDHKGTIVKDEKVIERINSLVIPPAWDNVWICASKNGHIQATGRDVKGRKQYIYHPEWESIRNQTKFSRILKFGNTLPSIRQKVEEDLRLKKLSRDKVLALIVKLLDDTNIRVGNEEYEKANKSYGLTTLKNKHLDVSEGKPKLIFKGKSGKEWLVTIEDRRIAKIIRQIQELPGQQLFQYYDEENNVQTADSSSVNEYIKSISSDDFSAKDFRTWSGTVAAAIEFANQTPPSSEKEAKRMISKVVKHVAHELSNTPAISRKYYIHPEIINLYTEGRIKDEFNKYKEKPIEGLTSEETAVLLMLKERIKEG